MTISWTSSLTLLVALIGCGGTNRPQTAPLEEPAPASAYPSADELAKIASELAPPISAGALDVARWELAGPFPEVLARATAPEVAPWSGLVADAVQHGTLSTTADLHCVARELGRFYLEHAAQPADTLRRYVEGWCGTVALGVDVMFLAGEVPVEISDDELFASWKANAATLISNLTAAGDALAGIWFGRNDGRAVLAVARGLPRVEIEAIGLVPPVDGVMVLRGTMLEPAERLRVLVNRGGLGVAECELDGAIALPSFEARCAVDPADPSAWIEVSAVPPGRLLGKVVLRVLARRADASRSYALVAPPGSDAAGTATLANQVNSARQLAGLAPLALAETQGAVATALAPHYFAASLGGDPAQLTDRIALGLMAGWDVPAMVRDAGFYSSWVTSVSADHLVTAALDSPMGRSVLLDPRATHLAVGALADGGSGVTGGLFLTYQTLAADPVKDTQTVVDAITAARAERALQPLRALDDPDDRRAVVSERLRTGEFTLSDAMSNLLAYASRIGSVTASGWAADARDLADLVLPEAAFGAGDGPALILVAPYRPAAEPWWRWAVIVVADQR